MRISILILMSLSLSACASAEKQQEQPVQYQYAYQSYVSPAKTAECYPSYPIEMTVYQKNQDGHYLVSQNVSSGVSELGSVHLTSHEPGKFERLNTGVKYISTTQFQGEDGFAHNMDIWEECDIHKVQAENMKSADDAMAKIAKERGLTVDGVKF